MFAGHKKGDPKAPFPAMGMECDGNYFRTA
jgi:hypothetical protein